MAETELEKRVREVEADNREVRTLLMTHLESCDKRGAKAEKIQFAILAACLAILSAVCAQWIINGHI